MSQYGCTITKKGRELIAKVLASKTPLTLTRDHDGFRHLPG